MAVKVVSFQDLASALFGLADLSSSVHFQRLVVLASRIGCRSVVVLSGQSCNEWNEEDKAVFEALRPRIETEPVLVLFVEGSMPRVRTEKGVARALRGAKMIGCVLVRPRPLESVAEAWIAARPSTDEHYCTCIAEGFCRLPIGLDIAVVGIPSMEQDGVASSCAHASLWVASKLAMSRFGGSNQAEVITYSKVASSICGQPPISGRRVPTAGLNHQEILLALEAHGYAALSYEFDTPQKRAVADHVVYRYVESGIPVILLLELEGDVGHCVVVCGHTFDRDAWWPGARRDYYPSLAAEDEWISSACWTPEYIIVDDNYGPGMAMTRSTLRRRTTIAIVPLPRDVNLMLTAEDAEILSGGLLFSPPVLQAVEATAQVHNEWISSLASALVLRTEQPVLRTFLVESRRVREHLISRDGYGGETKDAARKLVMPEWVWMVEISVPGAYGDKLKLGELVLDPHMPKAFLTSGTEPFLWCHLVSVLWTPPTEETNFRYVPDERPVEVLIGR
jgi:hypothetical protein